MDNDKEFRRLEEKTLSLQIRPQQPFDAAVCDPELPPRIFVRDYYRIGARVNAYSKPKLLADIADALKGTPEFERIRHSQFGKLFEIPVRKAAFSGKIVTKLLCRQLWTVKPNEVWFVFGGHSIRFSLREFRIVTGLNCGRFPDEATLNQRQNTEGIASKYMTELVGNRRTVKVPDLVQMLKKNTDWPSWKKLCVALIVIIEGVVAVKSQLGVVNENIVEMCRDIDFFLEYPWGRHAFKQTIREIVKDKSDSSLTTLVRRLKQSSVAMHGFPLSIQLLSYESISGLDQIHREDGDEVDFTQRSCHDLTRVRPITQDDVILCESSDDLVVESIIHTSDEYEPENTTWEDDVVDSRIERLESMIKSGHTFNKHGWPGGDFTCPRVHSPAEKGVLKDYDAAIQRRKQKAELVAKRKRVEEDGEVRGTGGTRSRQGKKLKGLILDDQCAVKSRKGKGAANSSGLVIGGALEELKDFLKIQFAAVIDALRPVQPVPARKLSTKRSRQKRPRAKLTSVESDEGKEENSQPSKTPSDKSVSQRVQTFDDYVGVESVIRYVAALVPNQEAEHGTGEQIQEA